MIGQRRPGGDGYFADDRSVERKDARLMCIERHAWSAPKIEGRVIEYMPREAEISEAITAQQAFHSMLRHGDFKRLDLDEQKSLSAFSFSNGGWVVPPTVSHRILSCLTDEADFLSLFDQEQISSASFQFPLDNSELEGAQCSIREQHFASPPDFSLHCERPPELWFNGVVLALAAALGREAFEAA